MALESFKSVHAGDFKEEKDHKFVGGKLAMKNSGKFFREFIPLDQLETSRGGIRTMSKATRRDRWLGSGWRRGTC